MKISGIILITIFSFGLLSFIQSEQNEIIFHSNYAEAQKLAQKEKKIIFVDNYATWCGPCKKLDAKVFNNKEVADYFNANFINVKIDIEKGEGPSMKQKYKINSVPTMLFLDENGEVLNRLIGYMEADQLLESAKRTLKK